MLKSIILNSTKQIVEIQTITYKAIKKKNNKTIFTVIINNIPLSQRDKIVYICDDCKDEITSAFEFKKQFFEEKQYCKKCQTNKTKLEKYGDKNYVNSNKAKKTKLERYGNENYNNTEKNKKTMIERYGVEHNMQLKECRNKTKQTWKERYGIEEILGDSKRKEEGMIRKYGVSNAFQSSEIKEKIKQTNLNKYGVEHPMKIPEIAKSTQEKAQNTMIKKYGVYTPFLSDSMKKKGFETKNKNNSWGKGGKCKWYTIENQRVQGLFELELANWLVENKINFIAHKLKGIKYIDNKNKQRYYYPDFYLPDYNLYLEPHAKYFWDDSFEWKMKEVLKNINILYFNEDYNFDNILKYIKL